jgi:excinuclease UvrABC nuclease subunit
MQKIPLNKDGIDQVENTPGIYRIYSSRRSREPVYVGSSKVMKHRLQSYYQKDDYSVNRTKRPLRPHANFVTYDHTTIAKARKIEKSEKKKTKYNFW